MSCSCCCLPVRVLPAVFFFFGVFVSYFCRVGINIAILDMVEGADQVCVNRSSSATAINPETGNTIFCWTSQQQSLVKGMFYYGYMWLQLPGGRLAEIYGTKRVLGFGLLLCGLVTLVTPWLTAVDVWALLALRFLLGFFQGVLFPTKNPMLVRWSPIKENARFSAFASIGGTFGTIVIYPLSGLLVDWFGWQSVFYVAGVLTLVWTLLWFVFHTDEPSDHMCISEEEAQYIEENRTKRDPDSGSFKFPLWGIVTSPALWVILMSAMANDFGLYMLLTEGPNFMRNVLKKDIKTIGFLSSLPYFGRFAGAQLSGILVDFLIKRPNLLSKPNVRRMCICVALFGPAIGLAVMGYVTDELYYCIAVMTAAFTLNGFMFPAWLNVIDVAPMYVGTVAGCMNGFSSITGFIVPLVTSMYTRSDPESPSNWRYLFFTGTAFYTAAAIVFCLFARFEPEPFNKKKGNVTVEQELQNVK